MRKKLQLGLGLLIAAAALAGVAEAAGVAPVYHGIIEACYTASTVRVIDIQVETCRSSESHVHWQQVGIAGREGPIGPTGPIGPQGAPGLQGLQGAPGNTGPHGPQGPQGPNGYRGDRGAAGLEIVHAQQNLNGGESSKALWTQDVACPAGKLVISGGYAVYKRMTSDPTFDETLRGTAIRENRKLDSQTWRVSGVTNYVKDSVDVYATCINAA
jgi:hypothetical protein